MLKKSLLVLVLLLSFVEISNAQTVQDIIDEVSNSNLQTTVAELSGEQSVIINGSSQTITTRVHSNNDLAANYIEERLSDLPNLNVSVQNFNSVGKNIIATQVGKTNPDDIYLICAHYDSVTTFCADDNATGVAAVLEIARILSTQCTDNTIVYALWDEEEIGLLGAAHYAQQAADDTNGNTRDNILGVINMDMIGYDGDAPGTPGDNQFDIDVRDIANSLTIKDDLLGLLNTYTFDLSAIVVDPGTTASDHSRFWNENYSAVLVGESWATDDETPDYHTSNDRVEDIDFQYMTEITKLVASYIATKANLIAVDNTVMVTATDVVANDTSGTYQWINCDTNTPISGETSQVFSPSTDGNYAVEITSGSCTEISACVSFSVLGVENFTDSEIKIYPNPVTSILKIENNTESKISIKISDVTGKLISNEISGQDFIEMNISNNPAGIYFVSVSTKTKSSTFKIVKD